MEYVLLMWLCSAIPGNDCKPIEPEFIYFKDYHECSLYGYEYSTELVTNFSKEFVNEYKAYTKFVCMEKSEYKQET